MSKKYFKGIEDYEKSIIPQMCQAIESRSIVFISTDKRFKVMSAGENGYLYDWTYNLCRWGFARKSRNSDFHAQQHPYCPHQHMSGIVAHFLNEAVEQGFYERTTNERFDGGQDFQTIWM